MVRDCDREVERQARKLQDEEDQKMENDPITRQIEDLQKQAEILGEEGKLDEYTKVMAQIESLKDKRASESQGTPFQVFMTLTLQRPYQMELLDKSSNSTEDNLSNKN